MRLLLLTFLMFLSFSNQLIARQKKTIIAISRDFTLSTDDVEKDIHKFAQKAHPFGSKAQEQTKRWIIQQIPKALAQNLYLQNFTAATPSYSKNTNFTKVPKIVHKKGTNILVSLGMTKQPKCYVAIGSHYDTKHLKYEMNVGANDSGSSSLLLLYMIKFLHKQKKSLEHLNCDILAVWFDGEESQLPGWNDGQLRHPSQITDHTYGSRFFVKNLRLCPKSRLKACFPSSHKKQAPIVSLVLFDMIGGKDLTLTQDQNSSPELVNRLIKASQDLNLTHLIAKNQAFIEDDHLSFISNGIPAVNLIDFEHLSRWHNKHDLPQHISAQSIEKVGQLGLHIVLSKASESKAF